MDQPATFGGYEILAELGRGTTGVVYKARNTFIKLDRLVALKVPLLDGSADCSRGLARFRMEWQVLAYMTSTPDPTIASLYEVAGTHTGEEFLVREFVEGWTLEQRVAEGWLGIRQGIGVIATVASAVQRLHDKRFAHRNLLPSNVLIRTDGTPKLIGFGLVRLLAGCHKLPPGATGESPETDVRALQVLLGWLCTTVREPVPAALDAVCKPGSVANPGAFADALSRWLRES